jgi:hypothetical protein
MLSAREVQSLLGRLCADLGFCLPPDAQERLQQAPPATADDFTLAVFLAEGLDPSTADRTLYRKVQAAIAAAFRRSETEGR